MNNKLIIVIVIAIVVALVGIISVMLNNNYFQLSNTTQIQPIPNSSSPRHLSINLVENLRVTQNP